MPDKKISDETLANSTFNGTEYVLGIQSNNNVKFSSNQLSFAPQINVFTANGTWTKPAGCKRVRIYGYGGGGGGASGRRGATSSTKYGGGGGSSSPLTIGDYLATDIANTLTIKIAAGAVGGAAITANDTSGNAGATGGASTVETTGSGLPFFSAIPTLYSGSGGNTTSGAAGGGAASGGMGNGGGSSSTTANAGGGQYWIRTDSPGGGGGGGGMSSANTIYFGGTGEVGYYQGGTSLRANSVSGGLTTGANGANGTNKGSSVLGAGSGGGGGAAGDAAGTINGGTGGTGGAPGGGGGGGGASVNGANSGAGGTGGRGEIIILAY